MELQIDRLGKVGITVEQEYWSNLRAYDKLTIVQVEGSASTYISRIPVPPHTYLNNRKYWIPLTKNNDALFDEIIRYVDEHYISIVLFNQFCIDNGFQPIGSFSITLPTQTNFTLSNLNTTITRGSSYQNTITPNTHYGISSVTVKMGGVDITDDVYNSSTGTISISNVTGNIVISVTVHQTEFIINTSDIQGFTVEGYTNGTYLPSGTHVTLTFTKTNSSYNVNTVPYGMMGTQRIDTQSSGSPYTLEFNITSDVVLHAKATLQDSIYWGNYTNLDGDKYTSSNANDIETYVRSNIVSMIQNGTEAVNSASLNGYSTQSTVGFESIYIAYPASKDFPVIHFNEFNDDGDAINISRGKVVDNLEYNSTSYKVWVLYNNRPGSGEYSAIIKIKTN